MKFIHSAKKFTVQSDWSLVRVIFFFSTTVISLIKYVPKALLLNEYDLHGWKTKVCAKRKNIPGMKKYRGRNTYVLESMRPSPVYRRPGYG
ncbi:polyadenylate-binding protein 2-like [Lathyrus oleraceus]|uniref:polyadenylate-binding protein 2-like n=1 Tax=Pisum sativum TaxID=3888 RepID=UPI0021D1B657|nr:polyadenylate-binding protein 2-like [Pisum sativum]